MNKLPSFAIADLIHFYNGYLLMSMVETFDCFKIPATIRALNIWIDSDSNILQSKPQIINELVKLANSDKCRINISTCESIAGGCPEKCPASGFYATEDQIAQCGTPIAPSKPRVSRRL